MPNSYFQFKQFRIDQGNCAMKVTTDGCLLGAFAAQHISDTSTQLLDIGSGTGLLSLMVAQKQHLSIDAVELDQQAAAQLRENIQQSPWANRIQAYEIAIQEFAHQSTKQYDIIICNPPFYPNHLKSPNSQINRARHTDQLPFEELAASVGQLLTESGIFYLLLSAQQQTLFAEIAVANGLYCQEQHAIQDRENSPVIRIISVWGKQQVNQKNHQFIIKGKNNEYSSQAEQLLHDYYLIFSN